MAWPPDGEKFRRYLYSFWRNSRTWRTDGHTHTHTHTQTDTPWRHRPRLCIALRDKNQREHRKFDSRKILTHEDFNLKHGTHDYVVDITYQATFGSNRFSRGFRHFCDFFVILSLSYPFFLHHAPSLNCCTDSYAKWLKRRASNKGLSFWGQDNGWRHVEKICPKNSPIRLVNTPKRQNLYIAISPELLIRRTSGLRTEFTPRKALRKWSAITPKANCTIQQGHFENRYNVIFPQCESDLDEIRQPEAK